MSFLTNAPSKVKIDYPVLQCVIIRGHWNWWLIRYERIIKGGRPPCRSISVQENDFNHCPVQSWPKTVTEKERTNKCPWNILKKKKMEINPSLSGPRNCFLSKQGQFLSKHSGKFIGLQWDQSLLLCSLITAIHQPLSVDNCLTSLHFKETAGSFHLCNWLVSGCERSQLKFANLKKKKSSCV